MSTLTLRDLGFVGGLGGGAAYDTDAQTYITAVEAADGQALETAVKDAINAFVVGCKIDGIWTAIKACCILAGARTLAGALVPLVGPTPSSFGFVSSDYSRTLGLTANANNKYFDSKIAHNSLPFADCHLAVWKSTTTTGDITAMLDTAIGVQDTTIADIRWQGMKPNNQNTAVGGNSLSAGLHGWSRASSTSVTYKRPESAAQTVSSPTTGSASSLNYWIFVTNLSNSYNGNYRNRAPISFYSIGNALSLTALNARVASLIAALAAAIP